MCASTNKDSAKILISPVVQNRDAMLREVLTSDMVVIAVVEGQRLPAYARALNDYLGGQIAELLTAADFRGRPGETCLIQPQLSKHKLRHILVVGIGFMDQFHGPTVCGLFRAAFETAAQVQASKLCLPIPSNRLTGRTVTLASTGAILRCRLEQFAPTLPALRQVSVLCTPQAKAHLETGLKATPPRCRVCANPCLGS